MRVRARVRVRVFWGLNRRWWGVNKKEGAEESIGSDRRATRGWDGTPLFLVDVWNVALIRLLTNDLG